MLGTALVAIGPAFAQDNISLCSNETVTDLAAKLSYGQFKDSLGHLVGPYFESSKFDLDAITTVSSDSVTYICTARATLHKVTAPYVSGLGVTEKDWNDSSDYLMNNVQTQYRLEYKAQLSDDRAQVNVETHLELRKDRTP
jgi:hypothetical protein